MSNRFRPELKSLEARDVPAALSFQLPDGTIGSGLFSTPDGVDAGQSSQVLALADLSLTLGGAAYTVQSSAQAHYSSGVLVGVTATAFGPGDPIYLDPDAVQVGDSNAPVAYDGADTEVTFVLPDGTAGAVSFDVSWDLVDETQATQLVTALGFKLNLAGQNFTAPVSLLFEYGEFKGVNATFAFAPGFAYSSLAISGLDVAAIQAGTGLPLLARADTKGSPTAFINFAPLGTQANAYTLTVKFTAADGSKFEQTYNVGANNTAADVAALVLETIPQARVTPAGQGFPPIYRAGWYVKMNSAGTGFFVYSYRATEQQTWNDPKPVSVYKSGSATVTATGATSQPTVIETQITPK